MSDMLSIGASGLRAYQAALTTTSENIANAGTAGYVRRTANLREIAVSGASATKDGLGVAVLGIGRAGDMFRSAEVRAASADLARTETSAAWLERIEGALTANRLGDRITDFFNSARSVAADPSATAPRAVMLEAASSVAQAFSGTGEALASAAADLDATAEAAVSELSGLASALARVNTALGRTAPGTSSAAAMLDERDRLLESMSALVDIQVEFDGPGRASVRGGGGGPVLVQGDSAAVVTYVRDGGNVSFAAHRQGVSSVLGAGAGAFAGIAEGAQRITQARATLDALATDFTGGLNAFQASGRDLAGLPGAPMFETADSPTQVTLALTDPRGIAAAAVGGGVRDNRNLVALEALRGSERFEARLTESVVANASALDARRTVAEAQGAIRDHAVAALQGATAVNIDEEAVDLLRFQQAYQASSRVIQIAREALQSILDIR